MILTLEEPCSVSHSTAECDKGESHGIPLLLFSNSGLKPIPVLVLMQTLSQGENELESARVLIYISYMSC